MGTACGFGLHDYLCRSDNDASGFRRHASDSLSDGLDRGLRDSPANTGEVEVLEHRVLPGLAARAERPGSTVVARTGSGLLARLVELLESDGARIEHGV
jgi:hypothetical protein